MDEPKKWVWRNPSWIESHTKTYLEDGAAAHLWDSTKAGGPGLIPSLLLVTTGRKSGEPRYSPLIYGQFGDSYCVIASKGGFPAHPHWYLNLTENPECEIRVGERQLKVRAREIDGDERANVWAEMRKIYPPYDDYQARTDRQIPVLLLDPVA